MTAPRRAIVLIGPMGAGKTSIGRRAAKALGVEFYDSDIAVVRAHGPIEQIFAEHGEEQFREWEREAVLEGLSRRGIVALGGGAVLDPLTRTALAEHHVVLLTVQPRVVASRIRDTNRPLLQSDDAMARWTEILQARRPIYEELADVTFDTSSGPLQSVTEAIVDWANTAWAHGPQQEESE